MICRGYVRHAGAFKQAQAQTGDCPVDSSNRGQLDMLAPNENVCVEERFSLERRSISGSHSLLDPVGNLSIEFQSQGKPPVRQALAINHARIRLQLSVRRVDQQPLIPLPGVPHQHAYSQRADVLCRRPFRCRRLLQVGDPYGDGQPSPFFKSSRPHRHLVTHLPSCHRHHCAGLDGAEIANDRAGSFLTIILCWP